IDLLPNIYLPHLLVQTNYQNATPEEVEKLVTEPLESTIGTINGVKKINSVSKEGISVISVDFVWGTDMDMAVLAMREKLDNVAFALPRDAGRPTIVRADPSSEPIMSLVLSYKNRDNGLDVGSKNSEDGNQKEEVSSNITVKNSVQHGLFLQNSKFLILKSAFIDHSSPEYEIKRLIDLKEAARVVFKRRLEQIEGVAQAIITGGLEREILIEIDPLKLEAYNLTFEKLAQSLKSSNINLPAGSIMKGLFRYSLRTFGEYTSIDQIGSTVIKSSGNRNFIKLDDIADVKDNFKEREGLTRINGAETIGLLIYKEPASNTVSISSRVKEIVNILRSEYPEFDLLVVSDNSGFIEAAISNVKQEVLYGGLLATLVLFFFLGSLRNIFAIAITIPAALVITILLMYLFRINFNIISLGGIAVGIGMLLDNSIIVIENIMRYKEKGLKLKDAAIKGASEVSMPVVAATLTTIVVFLPLVFIRGITGELFRDQSLAIVFSLSASILAALTLIPLIASKKKLFNINKEKYSAGYISINGPGTGIITKIRYWISLPFIITVKLILYMMMSLYLWASRLFSNMFGRFFKVVDRWMVRLIIYYEKLLLWALDNKSKVIISTIVLVVLTVFAAIDIKKEFIPESAQDQFILELVFPRGTSLRGNAEIVSKIEKAALNIAGVQNLVSNIGRVNEFDYMNKELYSVNKSNLIFKLDTYEKYYSVREQVRTLLKNFSGIDYSFKQVKTAYTQVINPSDFDVEIKIKNKDINAAHKKAETVIDRINKAGINGIKEIFINVEKGLPGYDIKINREKCIAYDIDISDVSNKLVNSVKGNEATFFSDFDKKIGIRLKLAEKERRDINKVLNQYVISGGVQVPLSKLVDVSPSDTYNEIWHEDQSRTLFVYASLDEDASGNIITQINNIIERLPESPEEIITAGGVNDEIRASFSSLYVALVISILLMYMILASEFESFLFPFIIIFSVPLGLIGGILLLYILGDSISVISLMGLIILVGIADNDAVVKVEFILRKREEGLSVKDAIIQAGHDRFRPIIMNSLTVIFGLIPMIIGIGAATQLRISLAVAVVGGLVSATVLTLIIIPVLYSYLEKFSNKKY
ncbi:MAG: efflux RND transporter permease subunit, partial [Melioribacteraceae bacterium]|nr:efflux RND transporter permease subunit [Melioribacteraceae bacterium]